MAVTADEKWVQLDAMVFHKHIVIEALVHLSLEKAAAFVGPRVL